MPEHDQRTLNDKSRGYKLIGADCRYQLREKKGSGTFEENLRSMSIDVGQGGKQFGAMRTVNPRTTKRL